MADTPIDTDAEKTALLDLLHREFFNRPASDAEMTRWQDAGRTISVAELVRRFIASPGFRRSRGVPTFWAPGHYYSPVVDPATLGDYVERARAARPEALGGISIDTDAMLRLWDANVAEMARLELPGPKQADRRYFVDGGPFPAGDAASLFLMMSTWRPRRIVEIGSGFSTAAMLDFAEQLKLAPFSVVCVEPYPDRLRSLLKPADAAVVTLIERPVQQLHAAELVADLEPGDFLFIDSTHVMKTGSDVHHEIFDLLPRIKPGVIFHVHDCPYPFEYPDAWIKERNYSWNEAYALRAFLSFNESFEVVFWASMLKTLFPGKVRKDVPHHAQNAGSSIWMRRTR